MIITRFSGTYTKIHLLILLNTRFLYNFFFFVQTLASIGDSNNTKYLNHRNITGHTPLHVACLADKPDCVTALIAMGADVNLAAGSPSGSTPHNPLVAPAIMGDFVHDMHSKLQPQVS